MIGGACSCQEIERMLKEFLGEVHSIVGGSKRSTGKKRAPSQYNLFIGSCMKEEGNDMKTCARLYKEQKTQ